MHGVDSLGTKITEKIQILQEKSMANLSLEHLKNVIKWREVVTVSSRIMKRSQLARKPARSCSFQKLKLASRSKLGSMHGLMDIVLYAISY